MPVAKGEEWGSAGELPEDAPDASSDAEVAALLTAGHRHLRPRGGDLARTLGVSPKSLERPAATLLPVDALSVTVDDEEHLAVAHVCLGSRRRPTAVVMNAAFLGDWNAAPRAHPGDGKADVVEFDLGLVDWFKARRRLRTGTHVPHPGIRMRSRTEWSTEHDRAVSIVLDGHHRLSGRRLHVRVIDEAFVAGV